MSAVFVTAAGTEIGKTTICTSDATANLTASSASPLV